MLCLKSLPPAQGGNSLNVHSVVFRQQPTSVSLCRENEEGAQKKLNEMTDEACNCLGWYVLYMYIYMTQPWLEGS